jgi:hypothetical protein
MTRWVAAIWIFGLLAAASPASAQKPDVPPGNDPGGIAVAVLGSGVDYTDPRIANCLARDGEGDPIAWDFADDDNRPFRAEASAAAEIGVLCEPGSASRVVIVKQQPTDPTAFGHMMLFTSRTPARIVVWPDADPARPDWHIFQEAVTQFPQLLFIIPKPAPARRPSHTAPLPSGPAPSEAANLVSIPHIDPQAARITVLKTAGRAALLLASTPSLTPAEIKSKLTKP